MEVKKTEMQLKEVVVSSHNLCDKCNQIITYGAYDAFEFKITHKTGKEYLDGGYGENHEVELCSTCATECMNLLKSNGYRITESEWDY